MPDIKKAIIIGGGPAGLAASLLLNSPERNNIQTINIYELRPEPSTMGGAIGIPGNGLRLLDRLGVYKSLAERASLDSNLIMHSASGGLIGEADWMGYVEQTIGYGYMRVKRAVLTDVLLDAVKARSGVGIHFGKRMISIQETEEQITVEFDDGTVDTADLLIGCDGIHSATRSLYVDPGVKLEYTGFAGSFSSIPTSSLPKDLIPRLGVNAVLTTEGMFAVIPCTPSGDELFWFFSGETPLPESTPESEDTRDGWAMHKQEQVTNFKSNLLSTLAPVKGSWGSTLRSIITHTDNIQFYPVYRLPSGGRWTHGRCILLGDAAHAMSPHAGQGVSMAMEDIFALSNVLTQNKSQSQNKDKQSESFEEIWNKYDAIRRPRIEQITRQAGIHGDMRKRTGPWGLWVKECVLMAGSWVYWALGLSRWGIGQRYLVYDVEEV
ncbi:hypothetical protein BJX99DRAFT_181377 [Aspergillus californicus]